MSASGEGSWKWQAGGLEEDIHGCSEVSWCDRKRMKGMEIDGGR